MANTGDPERFISLIKEFEPAFAKARASRLFWERSAHLMRSQDPQGAVQFMSQGFALRCEAFQECLKATAFTTCIIEMDRETRPGLEAMSNSIASLMAAAELKLLEAL